MESRFEAHVTRLRRGGGPGIELIHLVSGVMRAKLSERNLFRAPPAFVGFPEIDSWCEDAALDLLAVEAVEWAIVRRLRALCARMDAGDNVDGFVFTNLDHFLTERQRHADPIGYATYRWVQKVLEERVEAGRVRCTGGVCRGAGAPLDRDGLAALVTQHARWPALMHGLGCGGAEAGVELRALFDRLEALDRSFEVEALIAVLRTEARRWQSLLLEDDALDESAQALERVVRSRQLIERLGAAIEASGGQKRRREDLHRVLVAWREAFERGDEWTQADLARALDMKKTTISDHIRRLRALALEIDPPGTGDVPLVDTRGVADGPE